MASSRPGWKGRCRPFVAAGIALAVVVALTGALHVDALADTADAIGAGRARALEVMRDSRIGAFGAVAVALAVLVEAGAVGGLRERRRRSRGVDGRRRALSRGLWPGARARAALRAGGGRSGERALRPRLPFGASAAAALAVAASVALLGWDGAIAAGVAAAVAIVEWGGAVACG